MARSLFHIGCDWGTSSSKMVVRDLSYPGFVHGRAHPVVHQEGGQTPRCPSTVALAGGRLWFGFDAEKHRGRVGVRLWDSLKAKAGVGNAWEEPAVGQLTLQDLVTLSLTQLLGIAQDQVISPLAAMRNVTPVTRATVSVPTQELQQNMYGRYLRSTLIAMRLALFDGLRPSGQTVADLRDAVRAAEARISTVEARVGMDWDQYLRPESMAAMLWLHRLPQVGEGAYCMADVGAATVHASFFRIHGERGPDGVLVPEGGMSLFGGATEAVGMDRIGERLVELGAVSSVAAARGHEEQLMAQPALRSAFDTQLEAIRRDVWREADRAARIKVMIPPRASERLTWLVVGGGSRVPKVRALFESPPEFNGKRAWEYSELAGAVQPDDLYFMPNGNIANTQRYKAEPEFLMVAYGLSFPRDHCPVLYLPTGVAAMTQEVPVAHQLNADELWGG